MHTDAHPVKNNQQPPISFWHAKEGTLKKSTKCCAKLSSILFQVGYTLCLSPPAFISTSTSLCLHHPQSCNAPASWSAGLRVKQRWWLDSGWLQKNYYKNVVWCVCVFVCVSAVLCPFPIQPTPSFTRISCIFTVHPDIMESVRLWNLHKKMYIHKFHYKKVSNIRVLTKPRVLWVRDLRESTWIIASWLHDLVYVWMSHIHMFYKASVSAQFTELHI